MDTFKRFGEIDLVMIKDLRDSGKGRPSALISFKLASSAVCFPPINSPSPSLFPLQIADVIYTASSSKHKNRQLQSQMVKQGG